MLLSQRLFPLLRQQSRRLDNILNLPPVNLNPRQRFEVLIAQPHFRVSHLHKSLPDMKPALDIQGRVVDGQMDS